MPRKQITIGLSEDMMIDQVLIEHHIKSIKNTKIIFKCSNGVELLQKLSQFKPDIIILDLYMPFMNGWEVLLELKQSNYEGKIICLSNSLEPNLFQKLKDLNVTCFAKKLGPNIQRALYEAISGGQYFDENEFTEPKVKNGTKIQIDGREIEILNKLAEGKTSKLISEELGGLSSKTVETYIQKLTTKVNCNNRVQLVAWACYYGLVYKNSHLGELPTPQKTD